jgi:hypothetical protein
MGAYACLWPVVHNISPSGCPWDSISETAASATCQAYYRPACQVRRAWRLLAFLEVAQVGPRLETWSQDPSCRLTAAPPPVTTPSPWTTPPLPPPPPEGAQVPLLPLLFLFSLLLLVAAAQGRCCCMLPRDSLVPLLRPAASCCPFSNRPVPQHLPCFI